MRGHVDFFHLFCKIHNLRALEGHALRRKYARYVVRRTLCLRVEGRERGRAINPTRIRIGKRKARHVVLTLGRDRLARADAAAVDFCRGLAILSAAPAGVGASRSFTAILTMWMHALIVYVLG